MTPSRAGLFLALLLVAALCLLSGPRRYLADTFSWWAKRAQGPTPTAVATPARARAVVGQPAPDFTLPDLDGGAVHLAEQIGRRPLLLEFGSMT